MSDGMKNSERNPECSANLATYLVSNVDESNRAYPAYPQRENEKIEIPSVAFLDYKPMMDIQKVHDAIVATDNAIDANARDHEGIDQYRMRIAEISLISLAHYIQEYQDGIYYKGEKFENFDDRMAGILEALKTSKALCRNLCDPAQQWGWRIAATPTRVLREQFEADYQLFFPTPLDSFMSGVSEETGLKEPDSNAVFVTLPQLELHSEMDAIRLEGGRNAAFPEFDSVDQQAQRADSQQLGEEHADADRPPVEAVSHGDCILGTTTPGSDCIRRCNCPESFRAHPTGTQEQKLPNSISVRSNQRVKQSQGNGADVSVPENRVDTDLGQESGLHDDLTPVFAAEMYTGDAMDSRASGAPNGEQALGSFDHAEAMSIEEEFPESVSYEQYMADGGLDESMHKPHDGQIPRLLELASTAMAPPSPMPIQMAPGGTFSGFEDAFKMSLEARRDELNPLEKNTANTLHLDDDMTDDADDDVMQGFSLF